MKFAFIIMGNFSIGENRGVIHNGLAQIISVSNVEEACIVAKQLYDEGVVCIELCGAFGEEGARAVINATGNKIPIGHVVHLPEQDTIYESFFPEN